MAVPAKTKTKSGYAIAAAREIVGITMATYLTISLGISLLMNWYNKRIAIQEK